MRGNSDLVYTHQILGSPKQVIYYARQRLYYLKKSRAPLELEMWETVLRDNGVALAGTVARLGIVNRCEDLRDEIALVQQERATMSELLKLYSPCTNCGGSGEIRHQIAHDESRYTTCSTCRGSCVQPSTD